MIVEQTNVDSVYDGTYTYDSALVFKAQFAEFAERFHFDVIEDVDDFDYYKMVAAVLKYDEKELKFVLMQYKGYPAGTVTIYLPLFFNDGKEVPMQATTESINLLMHALGIAAKHMIWRRDSKA